MTTNPYFNLHGSNQNERDLVESLIIESIQMYGLECLYIPKEFVKLDQLYGEDVLNKFEKTFPVEMYVKKTDNFGGDGDFLSKLGLEIRDSSILTLSRKRFFEATNNEYPRPQEGSLIYFPYQNYIFKIMFVEDKSVFFNLGELYVWDIKVELFDYSHEQLNTGIEEVDSVADQYAFAIDIGLAAGVGQFNHGEQVYQGTDLAHATAKAVVISQDDTNNTLRIRDITGTFKAMNGPIKSSSALTTRTVVSVDTAQDVNDILDDNKNINNEVPNIIDFSESNPFSEGEEE